MMGNAISLAAIDLGSNSFRLQLGSYENGELYQTEYFKEPLRLGQLDETQNIPTDHFRRGLACLARFSERLNGFDRSRVRAVATQTLREAKNRHAFVAEAEEILRFPIEIISGREEARLVFSGATYSLPQTTAERLVLDIGGRSTAVVCGVDGEASDMESYPIGCVSLSQQYFPDGHISTQRLTSAKVAAMSVLEEVRQRFRNFRGAGEEVYGCAGTFRAISDILDAAHGTPAVQEHSRLITREGVAWLKSRMVRSEHVQLLDLDHLTYDRRPVLPGGVCVLEAMFELMNLDQIILAEGGLRHGVLHDLIERADPAIDRRARSVDKLMHKFGIDIEQAHRVRNAAITIFVQIAGQLPQQTKLSRKLGWAAALHEIGTRISHESSHKHGAYILRNANITGFSVPELDRLSLLVLGCRGKLKKLDFMLGDDDFVLQLMSLRLATLLCHARTDPDLSQLRMHRNGYFVGCIVSPQWAKNHPQSLHLIQEEATMWENSGLIWRLKTM
jgi:exopolyphosphatase / guanosine-5'-triphosphate,3'-diphosphate pyrophosphatase